MEQYGLLDDPTTMSIQIQYYSQYGTHQDLVRSHKCFLPFPTFEIDMIAVLWLGKDTH